MAGGIISTNDAPRSPYYSQAVRGAGLVFVEMTDVSPEARISPGCTCLHTPAHAACPEHKVAQPRGCEHDVAQPPRGSEHKVARSPSPRLEGGAAPISGRTGQKQRALVGR